MKSDELNSVVASNLMRSYRAIKESGRQNAVLPASIKNVIAQLSEGKSLTSPFPKAYRTKTGFTTACVNLQYTLKKLTIEMHIISWYNQNRN